MAYHRGGPKSRGLAGDWVHGRWYPALELLPDQERTMPHTVPDDWVKHHFPWCRCQPCRVRSAAPPRR